ncbi:hypothetical protein F4808DRAFT_457236 [Astrocystis sublimbata]|nr:hypothetical protein F4808DRAFT_457236 [Astrocystis sublimbata]
MSSNTERKMDIGDGKLLTKAEWIHRCTVASHPFAEGGIYSNGYNYDNYALAQFEDTLRVDVAVYENVTLRLDKFLSATMAVLQRKVRPELFADRDRQLERDADDFHRVLNVTVEFIASARFLCDMIAECFTYGHINERERLRIMAIALFRQRDLIQCHIDWLNYWSEKEPENLKALLKDAREFPAYHAIHIVPTDRELVVHIN